MAKKRIQILENLELLKTLYMIASPSGGEKSMRKFICKWIRKNVPNALIDVDKFGNIYVVKGVSDTYPCQVAHIDEVHERKHGLTLMFGGDIISGRNNYDYRPEGIGGDDKNGIYIALMLLKNHDICKCAFFVGEEVGCVGSNDANIDFFSDCRYILQCDRKGNNDFVNNIMGMSLSTDEFINDIGLADYGYATHDGGLTDVYTLKKRGVNVCVANMSCGYYNPHSEEECTSMSDLQNTYNLCDHIFKTLTKVYPHDYEPATYTYYGRGGYGGGYGFYNWYDWYSDKKSATTGVSNSKDEKDIPYTRRHSEAYSELVYDMTDSLLCMGDVSDFDLPSFYENYREFYPELEYCDYQVAYFDIMGETWVSKNNKRNAI